MTAQVDFSAFINVAVEQIKPLVEQANEIAQRVQNAGNTNALVHEVRDKVETSDETILAYRDWFDKAQNEILKRQEIVEKYILDNNLVDVTPVDVEAESQKYQMIATQVKALKKAVEAMPGGKDAELPDLITLSGRGGGSGVTGPRPRINSILLDGQKVEQKVKNPKTGEFRMASNFSVLAAELSKKHNVKVEVKALQSAAFDAAGTQDLTTLNGKPFSFSFSVTPENGEAVNHMIEVTPSEQYAAGNTQTSTTTSPENTTA